jgi:hypothetical protein
MSGALPPATGNRPNGFPEAGGNLDRTRPRQRHLHVCCASTALRGFDRLPIAGTWREGGSGNILSDRDPYNGSVLVQIPQCNYDDLNTALESAAKAQAAWAAKLPKERAPRRTHSQSARGRRTPALWRQPAGVDFAAACPRERHE